MQRYYFILNENEYNYYSTHPHSLLFSSLIWHKSYEDAKEDINRIRRNNPTLIVKIYSLTTKLSEVYED